MEIASIKEVKDNLSQFLKKAEQEDIVITKNGRPTAVLHHLGEGELEDYLLEHDPTFKRKIEKRWNDYLRKGGTSIAAMLKELHERAAAKRPLRSSLREKPSAKFKHCPLLMQRRFSRKYKSASLSALSSKAKPALSDS